MKYILCLLAMTISVASHSNQMSVEWILEDSLVDKEGDRSVFATSFDYREGMIFVAKVEPTTADGNLSNRLALNTVVLKGLRQGNATWVWQKKIVESRTVRDPYHSQPSIAIDKNGYIHLAYNMHNTPWQYSISTNPYDISQFVFSGEAVTQDDLFKQTILNRTFYPSIGKALIPGNQITYPVFIKDQLNDLYVSYRFALKPKLKWKDRAYSAGIAKYDVEKKKWLPIGGKVLIKASEADAHSEENALFPFLYDKENVPYGVELVFDSDNGMHIFWNWRFKQAGIDTKDISYAYSSDHKKIMTSQGLKYSLPINHEESEKIEQTTRMFYPMKSSAVLSNNQPIILASPISGSREIFYLNPRDGWQSLGDSPNGATALVVDNKDRIWAFASGLKVFLKESIDQPWQLVGEIGQNLCWPKVKYYSGESRFVVHAKDCGEKSISIATFRR